MEAFELVQSSLTNFFAKVGEYAPTLVGALILLILGYIIAKIVKWGILKLLKAVNFNGLTENVGINDFLRKGNIKKTSSGLVASLFYWIIMFTVLVTFFNNLGLEVVSDLLNKVILFIPNIIVACILLVVGMYLANFVRTIVEAALKNGNVANAEFYGKIARGGVLFFTFAIVLTQLNIGEDIVNTIVQIVLGAFGIALAIAFGFGGRDWAAGVVNKYLTK